MKIKYHAALVTFSLSPYALRLNWGGAPKHLEPRKQVNSLLLLSRYRNSVRSLLYNFFTGQATYPEHNHKLCPHE